MSRNALKLTTYFGERDRADGHFLADALIGLYAREEVQASVLLRGVEGFGIGHHLATDRLLTLSEDLPIVSVAVDTTERIQSVLPAARELHGHGLITLERARMANGNGDPLQEADGSAKLTVYLGRRDQVQGEPAHIAVVRLLHDMGVAGATVLMGVDGTAHGVRRRARFVGANSDVPVMLIAVGDAASIAVAADALRAVIPDALTTLERIQVCKRDGQRIEPLRSVADGDESGLAVWQKLMVYVGEQARHGGHPVYPQLVRELRAAGARGTTVLRGIWGYHGDHQPHGDRLLALRRSVPVVAIVVDTPERSRRWFELIDSLTDETGLVTSELVPALRATGPRVGHGGLRLAHPTDS